MLGRMLVAALAAVAVFLVILFWLAILAFFTALFLLGGA